MRQRTRKAHLGRIAIPGDARQFRVTYDRGNLLFHPRFGRDTDTVSIPLASVLTHQAGRLFVHMDRVQRVRTSDHGLVICDGETERTIPYRDLVEMLDGQRVVV